MGVIRKLVIAFATLFGSLLLLAFLAMFIGGIFGIFWDWVATKLGYAGTTASEALKKLGDPSEVFKWFKQIGNFIWNNLIKPIIDWIKSLFTGGSGGSSGGGKKPWWRFWG